MISAALLVAGCTSSGPSNPASSPRTGAATSAAGSPTASPAQTSGATSAATTSAANAVPRFDHIVVVVLENHAYDEIIGNADAPFLNTLATSGAALTQSSAIGHPSEPNYLALFSGSTQGLTDDSCPHAYSGPNLAAALLAGRLSFTGYSEGLPEPGFTGCSSGAYARKHNPWVNFGVLPGRINQPMTAFPSNLAALPTVSFVIPNLDHDMHDGTIRQADEWLQTHLLAYADWSTAHNSLLIITTDEDDGSQNNRIVTILAGAHVRPGRYDTPVNHYGVLRTMLASYDLAPFGRAAGVAPLTTVWTE